MIRMSVLARDNPAPLPLVRRLPAPLLGPRRVVRLALPLGVGSGVGLGAGLGFGEGLGLGLGALLFLPVRMMIAKAPEAAVFRSLATAIAMRQAFGALGLILLVAIPVVVSGTLLLLVLRVAMLLSGLKVLLIATAWLSVATMGVVPTALVVCG